MCTLSHHMLQDVLNTCCYPVPTVVVNNLIASGICDRIAKTGIIYKLDDCPRKLLRFFRDSELPPINERQALRANRR